MKIFIFSTTSSSLEVTPIIEILKTYKDLLIRTSGSKGLDSLIPSNFEDYEVYVPWEGFNDYTTEDSKVFCPNVKKPAVDFLQEHVLGELKPNYVKIDNRLVCGLLGENLDSPVDLVIINNIDSNILPTTSSALVERMAIAKNIPVVNLEYSTLDDLSEVIKGLQTTN